MKIRFVLIIALSLASLVSCGTDSESESTESSIGLSGSWSTDVGGSLAGTDISGLAPLRSARFYRVYRYVGLGITHEFVGLSLVDSLGHVHTKTTGLVGEGDHEFFVSNLNNANKVQLIRTIRGHQNVVAKLKAINSMMRNSAYHNRLVYAAAMTSTPLTGRPCANVAAKIVDLVE